MCGIRDNIVCDIRDNMCVIQVQYVCDIRYLFVYDIGVYSAEDDEWEKKVSAELAVKNASKKPVKVDPGVLCCVYVHASKTHTHAHNTHPQRSRPNWTRRRLSEISSKQRCPRFLITLITRINLITRITLQGVQRRHSCAVDVQVCTRKHTQARVARHLERLVQTGVVVLCTCTLF